MKVRVFFRDLFVLFVAIQLFCPTISWSKNNRPEQACELPANPTQSECENCNCQWSNGSCDCSVVEVSDSGNNNNTNTSTTNNTDTVHHYNFQQAGGSTSPDSQNTESSGGTESVNDSPYTYKDCSSMKGYYDEEVVSDCYTEACIAVTGWEPPADGCYSVGCYQTPTNCEEYAECRANEETNLSSFQCANQTTCESEYNDYQGYQSKSIWEYTKSYFNGDVQYATNRLCQCYNRYGISSSETSAICNER